MDKFHKDWLAATASKFAPGNFSAAEKNKKAKKGRRSINLSEALATEDTAYALLYRYSPTGAALIDWATQRELTFQEGDLGIMGLCYPQMGHVVLNNNLDPALAATVLGHEIFHAVQYQEHGFETSQPQWDFQTILHHTLASESAAFSLQCRIGYEMKLCGHPSIWDQMKNPTSLPEEMQKKWQKYSPAIHAFEEAFDRAVKKGSPSHTALRAGTTAAQKAYTEISEVKSCYAAFKLQHYFNQIINGRLGHPATTNLKTSYTDKAFKGLNGALITDHVHLPKDGADLCGDDDLLDLAYQVEKWRHDVYKAGCKWGYMRPELPNGQEKISFDGPISNSYSHLSLYDIKCHMDSMQEKCIMRAAKSACLQKERKAAFKL